MSNGIMDNPGDAKYGFTHEQIIEGFKILKEKGAKHFGVHAFLASNTVTNEYYPKLARQLFELVVELRDKTGCDIRFINLSGGVGIPYRPEEKENDIHAIGEGVRKAYEDVLVPAGMTMMPMRSSSAGGQKLPANTQRRKSLVRCMHWARKQTMAWFSAPRESCPARMAPGSTSTMCRRSMRSGRAIPTTPAACASSVPI